jgi:hypothetical protein
MKLYQLPVASATGTIKMYKLALAEKLISLSKAFQICFGETHSPDNNSFCSIN